MNLCSFSQLNAAVLIKLLIPTQDVKDGYDYEEMRLVLIILWGDLVLFATYNDSKMTHSRTLPLKLTEHPLPTAVIRVTRAQSPLFC